MSKRERDVPTTPKKHRTDENSEPSSEKRTKVLAPSTPRAEQQDRHRKPLEESPSLSEPSPGRYYPQENPNRIRQHWQNFLLFTEEPVEDIEEPEKDIEDPVEDIESFGSSGSHSNLLSPKSNRLRRSAAPTPERRRPVRNRSESFSSRSPGVSASPASAHSGLPRPVFSAFSGSVPASPMNSALPGSRKESFSSRSPGVSASPASTHLGLPRPVFSAFSGSEPASSPMNSELLGLGKEASSEHSPSITPTQQASSYALSPSSPLPQQSASANSNRQGNLLDAPSESGQASPQQAVVVQPPVVIAAPAPVVQQSATVAALCHNGHPIPSVRLAALIGERYPGMTFLNRYGFLEQDAVYQFDPAYRPFGPDYQPTYIRADARGPMTNHCWIGNTKFDTPPKHSKKVELVGCDGAEYTFYKCYELGYFKDALHPAFKEPTVTLLRDRCTKDIASKLKTQLTSCKEIQQHLDELITDLPCRLALVLVLPPNINLATGRLLVGQAFGKNLAECPQIYLLESTRDWCALSQPLDRNGIRLLAGEAQKTEKDVKVAGITKIASVFKPAHAPDLPTVEWHHFNLLHTAIEDLILHFMIPNAQNLLTLNKNLELAHFCMQRFETLRDELASHLGTKRYANADPIHDLARAIADSIARLDRFIEENLEIVEGLKAVSRVGLAP